MGSKSNRARRLERARAERRMARLAAVQRRRRRVQAAIGGVLALVVLGVGTFWLLGGFKKESPPAQTLPDCTWTSRALTEGVEDTGLPPSNVPLSGVRNVAIQTNLGEIRAIIDVGSAICATASFEFLNGRGFYNDTRCHKLDTTLGTLTCGSKTGDDTSSPSYQFPREGLPRPALGTASPAPTDAAADPNSYYQKGSIVMTNIDENAVGSQFMIVYGDASALPGEYTLLATITSGLELVEQVAAGGAVDENGDPAAVGNPTQDLTITGITITQDLLEPEPTDSASATETPTDATSTETGTESTAPATSATS